eukprot:4420985-Pleurochrysis_carterae.AAC.1
MIGTVMTPVLKRAPVGSALILMESTGTAATMIPPGNSRTVPWHSHLFQCKVLPPNDGLKAGVKSS